MFTYFVLPDFSTLIFFANSKISIVVGVNFNQYNKSCEKLLITTRYLFPTLNLSCCSRTLEKNSIYRLSRCSMSSMMSSTESLLVAVCQMTSTSDREKNFETCKSLIEVSKSRGAKIVFLPECFDHVGESRKQSIGLAEPIDGPLIRKYQELAVNQSLWLSLGGFHEKIEENAEKIKNAHIVINDNGDIVSVYRKIHLFDVDIPGGVRLKESDYTIAGKTMADPVCTPVGKIGLGICYDMRFPEFSLSLVKAGAEILTYPSAFTQTTGMAHWESLLRSRAIESQCYVIAAAQTGHHNTKRTSYGNAMVIDPWGCITACCGEGTGVAMAEIKLDFVHKIRKEMPVWLHRRSELYGDILPSHTSSDVKDYMFGPIKLPSSIIFYKSQHSMAFVNRKTVVPGHVLVAPVRCAVRISDLSPAEVADLFCCVQKVQKIIETEHNASSSTVSVQDGPDAGRTIPHVHVHILPRKPGDFKTNDDVYTALHNHDKSETIKWRDDEDMTNEAEKLKKYFI